MSESNGGDTPSRESTPWRFGSVRLWVLIVAVVGVLSAKRDFHVAMMCVMAVAVDLLLTRYEFRQERIDRVRRRLLYYADPDPGPPPRGGTAVVIPGYAQAKPTPPPAPPPKRP